MARETAAQKKAREAQEAEAAAAQPTEAKPFDGVIVVVQRNEAGEIVGMDFGTSGDVRKTEIGDILALAEVVHTRQIKS